LNSTRKLFIGDDVTHKETHRNFQFKPVTVLCIRHINTKMAVMKTCCGCFSTKSGTFAILLLYAAAYIACIVAISINLKGDKYEKWYKESVLDSKEWQDECSGDENMKLWKCKTSYNMQWEIKGLFIGVIVSSCIFFVAIILALIGTAKDKHWPILPWIILEFIRLLFKTVILILIIILWAVNMSEGADTSNLIATSVIGAVILAFYFYVWLCVVSHFQTIKEITDLGLLDKGASGAVLPFVAEDGDAFSNKTADSTVNMRDDGDNDGDDDENEDGDDKEELESISDDENKDDKKDDDPENPKEDNRPKSTKSERAKSARSTTSSIVADMRPDAEEE